MDWLKKYLCPLLHTVADVIEKNPAETVAVLRGIGTAVAVIFPASAPVVATVERVVEPAI